MTISPSSRKSDSREILIAVAPNAPPAEVAAAKAKANEVRKKKPLRARTSASSRSVIPMTTQSRKAAS